VPKAQVRIANYWKSRRVSQLSPRPDWGKSLWLSAAPEQVIRPLAEKYGAALIANPFDLLRGTYTAFSDYDALYREAVRHTKPNRVIDGVRRSLTINAESSHVSQGKVFPTPGEARRHNITSACRTFALLIVIGAVIGTAALYIASEAVGITLFAEYLRAPLLLVLNILPGILLLFALYFISNRVWLSFTVTALAVLVPSCVNLYKITYRGDVFLFNDLTLFHDGAAILRGLLPSPLLIIVLLAVIAGAVALSVIASGRIKRGTFRTVGLILTLCVLLISVNLYTSDAVAEDASLAVTLDANSAYPEFTSLGFVYPFLRSAYTQKVEPPDGYTEKRGAEIIAGFADLDMPNTKKVNIIAVMCESFTDLGALGVKFDIDPYADFKELKSKSYAGELVTNASGIDNTDTEWAFLTGYPQVEKGYRSSTESFVRYLKSQGYYAEGAFPYSARLFNRGHVNEYLGFDNYSFSEDDAEAVQGVTLFPEVAALFGKYNDDAPYFSFSVTYQQNSQADEKLYTRPYLKQGKLSDENFIIVNNYLYNIQSTAKYLSQLAEYINNRPEPIVFIVFGGGKPALGSDNTAYSELDISFKGNSGQRALYTAPYLIYANAAAKPGLGGDFAGSGDTLSPCFLLPKLFELGDMGGSGIFQLARETLAVLPVISSKGFYIDADNKFITKFSAEQAELKDLAERYKYAAYFLRWKKLAYADY
jgi:hypothetical protein